MCRVLVSAAPVAGSSPAGGVGRVVGTCAAGVDVAGVVGGVDGGWAVVVGSSDSVARGATRMRSSFELAAGTGFPLDVEPMAVAVLTTNPFRASASVTV